MVGMLQGVGQVNPCSLMYFLLCEFDFFSGRAFAIICRIILVFLAVHIIALLAYQTPWPQEYFTDNSTTIR